MNDREVRDTIAAIKQHGKRIRKLEARPIGGGTGGGGISSIDEGPDIDIVGNRVGRGGDSILLFNNDGNPVDEFIADYSGLVDALSAANSGEVVQLPAIPITLTGIITIPSGVTLRGMGREVSSLICTFYDYDLGAWTVEIDAKSGAVIEDLTYSYSPWDGTNDVAGYGIYSEGAIIRRLNILVNYGTVSQSLNVIAIGGWPYASTDGEAVPSFSDISIIYRAVVNSASTSWMSGIYQLGNDILGNTTQTRAVVRNINVSMKIGTTDTSQSIYAWGFDAYPNERWIIDGVTSRIEMSYPASSTMDAYSEAIGINPLTADTTAINCHGVSIFSGEPSGYSQIAGLVAPWSDMVVRDSSGIAISTSDSVDVSAEGVAANGSTVNEPKLYNVFGYGSSANGAGYGITNWSISGKIYAYSSRFYGNTKDIYLDSGSAIAYLYATQYSTINAATIEYLRGDRAAYSVEDYHANDIEGGTLTRHNSLPGTAGAIMVSDGTNWVNAHYVINDDEVVTFEGEIVWQT